MMAQKERKCPDCSYDLSIYAVLDKGDGKCKNCKGTGKAIDSGEALTEFMTLGLEKASTICKVCSGTGQCQTCGGTGYEYYQSDDENTWLGKTIGFLIIAAAIIWLVFAVAIPLIFINVATIALIAGLTIKKWSKFLFPISILGTVLIAADYNLGWFTKTLIRNVSFFESLIPLFFYLNITTGFVAAYFLIRDYLNSKSEPEEGEGELSKRNLIVMGCLLLVGSLTIGLQKYFDSQSANKIHSIERISVPDNSQSANPAVSNPPNVETSLPTPAKKSFHGNVGKFEAFYELVWNSDGTIEGIYRYPKRPNITYILKGKDLGNGSIKLTEYTENKVSANCNLSFQNNCYTGEMNNADGRVLKMTMCPTN